MKIFELAQKLKAIYDEHGDIDVHFAGPNGDQEPYSVLELEVIEVEDGDYPEDYNMPAGYKFLELQN
jgi:hypothetical protein